MYKHFFKRLFDLIIALFALPFVLLLILIMVPLIWLTDRGPTFYNAQRVGLNGKIFKMFSPLPSLGADLFKHEAPPFSNFCILL